MSGDTSEDELAATNEATARILKLLVVGAVIDQKYRIDEIIGRGAMGMVVGATHVHLKERVALKFLSTRGNSTTDDFRSRFQREAKVSAKLRNEHITRVMDVGVFEHVVPYMVMDHLVGLDLRQTFRAQGTLPLGVALDYVVQICEGMAEAHAHGIVHRDLKPSNLFVTRRSDGSDLIKILDFGISKWSASETSLDDLTRTGVVLGSPKYMSPEQLFGSSAVDARADVWSIAAIFYEMVSGRPPYDQPTLVAICAELGGGRPPPTLTSLNIDVPPALDEVVMRCFARDPNARVQNVAELAFGLLDAIQAPFASAVEQKISSVLAGNKGAGGFSASGGFGNTTGTYGSLSASVTGSSAPRRASAPNPLPAHVVADPKPASKSRFAIAVAVFAIGVAVIVGAILVNRREDPLPPAAGASGAPSTDANGVAPFAPTRTPLGAREPTTTSPPAGESEPARPSTTQPAPAPSPRPASPTPRAPVHAVARPRADPPAAVAAPPPVAVPAPAAPAPADTAKKKVNPLEDRQ